VRIRATFATEMPPDLPTRSLDVDAAQLEAWFDTLLENSHAGLAIISTLSNRYVRANQALSDLYGIPVAEILACEPFSMALRVTHPDDIVPEQKLFAELIAGTRRSYRFEKRFVRPDGSLRWGRLTFSGISTIDATAERPASVLRFVVIEVVDISDKKALEETLQRRDEELRHAQKVDGIGRLAAGVAHDFNNLLTVIMGHAGLLKQLAQGSAGTPNTPPIDADVDAILAAAERAASLTDQLLAYGRRTPVAPCALALSDAVATLQRLLDRTLGTGVDIEQSLAATGCILADEGQIGQVVVNLVLNARDALPEGGRIRLATEDVHVAVQSVRDGAALAAGEWVALSVSDTGHGMSPEVQARMFEPFFTTRTDRPGTRGTGLGLSTVQRIVAEAGGQVAVRSVLAEGTTVTAYFPRFARPEREIALPRMQARSLVPNNRRVLVVDDDSSVRSLIATILLGARYWVMVARDGQEALQFIEAERESFDLIVTDLLMPVLGGMALAKHVHALPRAAPQMLFISGYSQHMPADLSPYGSLLPKPFTPAQLLEAVQRALNDVVA
jgi:PAS domain S-box-containing protein